MTRRLLQGTRLVVASHNPGKVREILDLIAPHGLSVVSAAELQLPEPEETGATFAENARIKAEAAARGAASEGGTVLGILPGANRSGANPYLSMAIPTGMGEARNTLIVRSSDALIAVAGEFGTLSEIAFALKIGVPVVGLATWELSKAGHPVEAFPRVSSPEEAVREALRLVEQRPRQR